MAGEREVDGPLGGRLEQRRHPPGVAGRQRAVRLGGGHGVEEGGPGHGRRVRELGGVDGPGPERAFEPGRVAEPPARAGGGRWQPVVGGWRDDRGPEPMTEHERPAPEIDELVGVYNADGSWRGELAYAVGKLTGRAHCGLCDITHRGVRRRREFDECVAALPVPFDLVHRDERSVDVAAASDDRTPCVLARSGPGLVVLLDPADLDRCAGDPSRLRDELDRAIAAAGLRWPARP